MRNLFGTLCLCLLSLTASGQTDRASLTGTIVDPAGAAVASARIEAVDTDNGSSFTGGPSATGNYVISVPRGNYRITVTATGFKTYIREKLTVPVAASVRQDVQLELGAITESITITGAAPLLRTESGDVSHNINYARANSLPVLTLGSGAGLGNIRNPLQVVTLLPGTLFSNDYVLRVNGLPANTQAVRIEGQDTTNGLWRQINQTTQAGIDAIEEVAIQTSNYAAEFGQAGGGYFNYTMKSGSNQLHGTAYDYFVNEAMHAGIPWTSDDRGRHIRNRQRRNDYGFTLGGPIVLPNLYDGHDRSFFFFNFEQFREEQFIRNGLSTVPIAPYRMGDFSQAKTGIRLGDDPLGRTVFLNTIFDPTTTRFAPNGSKVRDPFPDNIVPVSMLDPVALKIQSYLPEPNAPGRVNNYQVPGYANFRHSTIPSVKLNHALSNTIKLSGYYQMTRQRAPGSNGFEDFAFFSGIPQQDTAQTVRINYDQTLAPTLLLHLGVGMLHYSNPARPVAFDQSQLGLIGFYTDAFPDIGGLYGAAQAGGTSIGIGPGANANRELYNIKPTQNASLTWVKGDHTVKLGGEAVFEGFPMAGKGRANGSFGFSPDQTTTPYQQGAGWFGTAGFPYASFLLGRANSLAVSQVANTRLGNHSLGFFIQDNWKVTRTLTLDYGLRYDRISYLKEQYGRMQSFSTDTLNPTVGRLGAVIYEGNLPGRCGCDFANVYPHAWGPRAGFAYQLNQKTVLRGGAGITYGAAPNNTYLSLSVADFYTFNPPGFAEAATILEQGNPYRAGNPDGLPEVTWPNFDPGKYPTQTVAGLTPQSPFISIDRNAGRAPRIVQWSLSLQRELTPNLVIEGAYVGNRGAWFTAPLLADINYNSLRPETLLSEHGLDIRNAPDRALLLTPISSPAAAAAGFSAPAYPGMPTAQFVNQQLRPFPQYQGIQSFLGPPLGRTWYDSFQGKVTKRYSYGLDFQAAFTWQKELTSGLNSDTSYLTATPALVNDVFNRASHKQVSAQSQPFQFVFSFNYTSQSWFGNPVLNTIVKDWTVGGVLRYQSGLPIRVPGSNNQLLDQLARGPSNSAAMWGGGRTFWNRVPGEPLILADPNGDFDPAQQLPLNPAAFVDAAPGEFGTASPYYNDYRWQRQPSESLSLARNFRFTESVNLMIRGEFQNAANRLFYAEPSVGGFSNTTPLSFQPRDRDGQLLGGYGYSSWVNGGSARPRQGQMVIRLTF